LALPGNARLAALVVSGALSRTTIVWVAWRFPYASVDTGVAGYLATMAGARDLLLALPLLAVGFGTLNPVWVLAALGAAWALPHLFAWWVSQTLQGVNANTYDAVSELGDVAALGAMGGCAYLGSVGAL
jgi:cobalamin synthase